MWTMVRNPIVERLGSNTRKKFGHNVTSQFLFATCTFCIGYCARFLEDETCCIIQLRLYRVQQSTPVQVYAVEPQSWLFVTEQPHCDVGHLSALDSVDAMVVTTILSV